MDIMIGEKLLSIYVAISPEDYWSGHSSIRKTGYGTRGEVGEGRDFSTIHGSFYFTR